MRVFVALLGLLCLGLAGLNFYYFLENGHHWYSLIAAFVVTGCGLLDLYVSVKD